MRALGRSAVVSSSVLTMYILSKERSGTPEEIAAAFQRYQDYLRVSRERFPRGAFELASSAWYFDPTDHRCPHDAWLEEVVISERVSHTEGTTGTASIRINLLGAYHDGYIKLHYPVVHAYSLGLRDGVRGHADWRYDEFRMSPSGSLLHEIEWWHLGETGRWLIEASDVEFRWIPTEAGR